MPRTDIDYSNTIIYKIVCKDISVTDVYVGHTTNFVNRKCSHRRSCTNVNNPSYFTKIYKIIREHGGWDNWNMIELEKINCKDSNEARRKEQEYYELLRPTLNSVPPYLYKNNISQPEIEIIEPSNTKYNCSICKYNTIRKSQYDRHMLTTKHVNLTSQYNNNIIPMSKKCICGKTFNFRQGLFKHKKTCSLITKNKITNPMETAHKQPLTIIDMMKEMIESNNKLTNTILELTYEMRAFRQNK